VIALSHANYYIMVTESESGMTLTVLMFFVFFVAMISIRADESFVTLVGASTSCGNPKVVITSLMSVSSFFLK